ncbi:hypothetical protein AX14_002492, partial [Amanita brunnescens Koide BX004]
MFRNCPSISTSEPVTEAPAVPSVPADEPVTKAPIAQSVSLAGKNQQMGLPTNDVLVSYISYGDQVLPMDWLMKYNLAMKRIYARVCNTLPDQINNHGGFVGGFYEGERGMILDGQDKWQILVAVKQQWVKIPARHLFPEKPTSKGQLVVVISDEHASEIFITCKPNENLVFPLVHRGKGNRLAP